jgi:hypothetical protein
MRICANCGPLPDSEELYPLGDEMAHAVYDEEYEARRGPYDPPEPMPCGPVTETEGPV